MWMVEASSAGILRRSVRPRCLAIWGVGEEQRGWHGHRDPASRREPADCRSQARVRRVTPIPGAIFQDYCTFLAGCGDAEFLDESPAANDYIAFLNRQHPGLTAQVLAGLLAIIVAIPGLTTSP